MLQRPLNAVVDLTQVVRRDIGGHPTAMPDEPLTSRFGNRLGRITGSCARPSKLGLKSTVSSSMSRTISMASCAMRASVYR